MTTCAVRTFFGPCPFPAVARVVTGCVHEHIRDGCMCAEHVREVQQPGDTGGNCLECYAGPDSHDCPLSLISAEALPAEVA